MICKYHNCLNISIHLLITPILNFRYQFHASETQQYPLNSIDKDMDILTIA